MTGGREPRGGDEVTVLVVDGDPERRARTAERVAGVGERVTVETAAGLESAVEHVGTSPVDCVVSAHALADGDGVALTEMLRAEDHDLPVVLVAADGSEALAAGAVSAGVTEYVPRADAGDGLAERAVALAASHRERGDRRTALAERAERLERYRTLVETVPDGVFTVDADGRMHNVNERWAEMVDVDRETLEGRSFLYLVSEEIIPRSLVEEYFDVVRELLSSSTDRERGRLKTGVAPPGEDREHVYEAHVALLPYDEAFRGCAVVVRDVTDREERERRLRRQNERLEEFASVVSHDLRSPMTVACGWLDIAHEQSTGAEDQLGRVDDALERMVALLDDLLALARKGQPVADPEPVALGPVVTDAWSTVATGGASLEMASDRTVLANRGRLRQALENLFRNAVEHGSTDGQTDPDDGVGSVAVEVGTLPGGFYVEDDGPGIPAEERERVFETGYTGDDGTGFGLAIVREIAEAHGWSVAVTEGDAGGARFEFTGVESADAG